MKAISITVDTMPSDQTYLIGSSPLFIDLPTYTWNRPQATTNFDYALINAPSFITLTNSPKAILIWTGDYSDTGTFRVYIKTTETYSELTEIEVLVLYVTCVTAIAPST